MNSQVISIKVDPTTKKQAQHAASELGLSLSSVLKGFLKQFIRTKTITFSKDDEALADEIPSEYLIKAIKKARQNRKQGKGSPIFDNAKDAIEYLHKQGV